MISSMQSVGRSMFGGEYVEGVTVDGIKADIAEWAGR